MAHDNWKLFQIVYHNYLLINIILAKNW